MRPLLPAALAAALLGFAAAPAPAQQRGAAPAPAARPQSFGDWQRGCEKTGRAELCSLRQFVGPKENPRQPLIAVAIGRLTPDRKMAMVIKLPVQVDRNAGVGLRIDEGAFTTIPIQACDAGSCTAAVTLTEDMQKQLRGGKQAIVAFRSPQGQAAALPLSLQGLARGLASLK
ncbi:MAG: invasion associated locus B family protein [Alphaproteobacteria bacterium]|nr:invasion associated locus B family protein [Alphaproteobacteria bacterium]